MAKLKLHLLGSPRLERDGGPLLLKRRKAIALLVYLAVTRQTHSREALATLFWPDYDASRGRNNLRRELAPINKALGEGWLLTDREQVGLNPKMSLWLDVAHFQQLLAVCETHDHPISEVCADCLPPLHEAVELYGGDFLVGFNLPDCREFDEWQFFQAESLRQALASALERLVRAHCTRSEFEQAIPYARRWVGLDPLHEPAQRHLMQVYAWAGQQAAALRQYEECERILAEELGVPPDEQTTSLAEAIKTKQFALPVQDRKQENRGITKQKVTLPAFLADVDAPEAPLAVFVARDRELAELTATLETVQHGHGQVLFVIGGPGRGKTTVVKEFARQAQANDPELLVISGQCNAQTGLGDPYLPFREAVQMLTGEVEAKWAGGLISSQHARKLWEAMPVTLSALVELAPDLIDSFIPTPALRDRAMMVATENTPWLQQLISLTTAESRPLEQKRLFSQYTALVKAIASQHPLLVIIEDLHWVDASSSALLFHLSRQIGNSRILLIGTYRPVEVAVGWGDAEHPLSRIVSELKRQHGDIWLDLSEQDPFEGRQFVEAYLDTQANQLDKAFREAIFRHTQGHPLFTVELIGEMYERHDIYQDEAGRWRASETIDWQTLPARVEGVIERRISRLEEELQAVLTVASVEGEIFTAEVVARVQQMDERRLVQQLSRDLDKRHRLVTAQALERLGQQRLSFYRFRHHLFQHYLYHTLDATERAYLHEAVGMALENLSGSQTERVAVQLAHHFEQAGLTEKVINYLYQAGQSAMRLSANVEAIDHFRKGLALLLRLPETPERNEQELSLQIGLGNALLTTRGYAVPEVGQTYIRARELCQQVGETPLLFPALYGLWVFHYVRAEHLTARAFGEELLALAQRQQDPSILVARRALGWSSLAMGEFTVARQQAEQVVSRYNSRQHHALAFITGQDPGVGGLTYGGWALWLLGYPEQALKWSQEGISLARSVSHPHSLVFSLTSSAIVNQFRRERQVTQEQAHEAIALSTEHGLAFWSALATIMHGWASAEQEEAKAGLKKIRQGMAAAQATKSNVFWPYYLALQAEIYGQIGQPEAGLAVLTEAFAIVDKTEERFWEAELYRLRGELLRQLEAGNEAEAEKDFFQAIEVARRQEAKSLELRAVMSLSRLWQSQGRQAEAHQMLADTFGWFTEGFDTLDLQEAKALLAVLS